MKRQIKQLHIDSVEAETGEVDTAEEEVVIESPNNVLFQDVMVGDSGYGENVGVIESNSESDITKRLKELLKNPNNDPIPLLLFANSFRQCWKLKILTYQGACA